MSVIAISSLIHLLLVLMFSVPMLGYISMFIMYLHNQVLYPGRNILPQCDSPDGFTVNVYNSLGLTHSGQIYNYFNAVGLALDAKNICHGLKPAGNEEPYSCLLVLVEWGGETNVKPKAIQVLHTTVTHHLLTDARPCPRTATAVPYG